MSINFVFFSYEGVAKLSQGMLFKKGIDVIIENCVMLVFPYEACL